MFVPARMGTALDAGGRQLADLAVVLGIALGWVAFFAASGTVGAGYHLSDDHEIVRLVAELQQHPLHEVLWRWVHGDLALRFRPLYFVHRIAEAAVFGMDLWRWGLYRVILAILTSVLLYAALRSLRFPALAALAFAFFGLCGAQACIWWQLGPNETLGMVCLAVGLVGLGRWSRTGARSWRAVFWSGTVLASLSKESFVALLPVLALASTCSLVWQREWTWRRAIAASVPEWIAFTTVFVAEALTILFYVGTDRIGYAGASGIDARTIWVAARQLLSGPDVLRLVALAALFVLCRVDRLSGRTRALELAAAVLLLVALVIASQSILHAKSGLAGRYLVPGALGPAFLIACLLGGIARRPTDAAGEPPRGPRSVWRSSWRMAALLLSASLLYVPARARLHRMRGDAGEFASAGRNTQAFLDELSRVPADRSLLVAGGVAGVGEHFFSVRVYLAFQAHRSRVWFFFARPEQPLAPYMEELASEFARSDFFEKGRPEELRRVDVIGVLPGEDPLFRKRADWLDPRSTRRELPGAFVIYSR